MEDEKKQVWEIDVSVKGIAKRDRKVKNHRATIATQHDDLTDASKPLLGGLDIQNLAKKWINGNIKQVDKAMVVASPVTYKRYADDKSGSYTMKEMQIFNPRQFSHEVVL
jgi:CMP-N-acetylneuraminic acid synthetase